MKSGVTPVTPGTLDADIAEALGAAHADDTPDADALAARVDRVRRRLLTRIADDSTPRHVTVQSSEGGWHPLLPGIERKVLHAEGDTMSYLLRFAAGAVLPAHHHPQDEECVVLEGALLIGAGLRVPAGGFHLARKDMAHADITAATDTVVFLRGARPRADQFL